MSSAAWSGEEEDGTQRLDPLASAARAIVLGRPVDRVTAEELCKPLKALDAALGLCIKEEESGHHALRAEFEQSIKFARAHGQDAVAAQLIEGLATLESARQSRTALLARAAKRLHEIAERFPEQPLSNQELLSCFEDAGAALQGVRGESSVQVRTLVDRFLWPSLDGLERQRLASLRGQTDCACVFKEASAALEFFHGCAQSFLTKLAFLVETERLRLAARLRLLRDDARHNAYLLSAPLFQPSEPKNRTEDGRDWTVYDLRTSLDRTHRAVQFNFLAEVFPDLFQRLFPHTNDTRPSEQDEALKLVREFERRTGSRVPLPGDGSVPAEVLLYFLTSPLLRPTA